ncbi:MAG TPA: aconitase/3-isopropylmalate dehydratase large subunit family protein [Candidatus Angelobacter sp.]|jgi:3-isopropylmalate/(R)-2-methylmalate dehydratase large subunit|nr:aconitase/3-isopropylmalate dehydratase large subunit family protein [Candidatus Angelobacter sp.]
MLGKTISEKILSVKSGRDARAGDLVVCRVDCALGTDGSTPMALDYFDAMGGKRVFDPERIVFCLDHYAPAPNRATGLLHQRMRDFAAMHGIPLWEVGDGIGHQLIVESGRAQPGSLVVGADSHAVTYGALNTFGTGIGSSDLAAILMSGRIWLRVPESIKVMLTGCLAEDVYPKDIALALASELGADGASYQALEFSGPALAALDLEDRLVLSNLAVEMGAKNGIFPADDKTLAYLRDRASGPFHAVEADPDAHYVREITLDLDSLVPQLALPHQVDRVIEIRDAIGTPVQMVYLGTCTGGRVRDFHQALAVLKAGGGVAHGVQLVVTPASRSVLETLTRDGTLAEFISMGAVIVTPGCGSCCGTCGAIPGDGVNVISTANRNFKGRMGNSNAAIYLASPASCAAAAVSGKIADPREVHK